MDHSDHMSMPNNGSMNMSNNCSDMNMSHMSMSMSMWFHFSNSDVILFDFWHPNSVGGLIGSCAIIFLLAICYEAIKWFRWFLQSRALATLRGRPTTYESTTPITKTAAYHMRTFSLPHLIQTLLFVVQVVISYFLMLVFMTYNVWLALSVALGAGVGYFIFGARMTVLAEIQVADCCE